MSTNKAQNVKINWGMVSKTVGWDKGKIDYPSLDEVDELRKKAQTIDFDAMVELLRYHRFLEMPETEDELEISNRIAEVLFVSKAKYCM